MKLKDICQENRPRERFAKYGSEALSCAELLAIILQNGTRNENVIDLSNRLLTYDLNTMSLNELQQINGIGPAKAMQIKAVFELNNRIKAKEKNGKQLKNAKDVFDYAFPKIGNKTQENFLIILLDTKNKPLKDEIAAVGTLNTSLIHPREIFKSAIKESANSIIVVHNHPSQDPSPSKEDIETTKVLIDCGKLVGIKVLDHVIIGKTYWSYVENEIPN